MALTQSDVAHKKIQGVSPTHGWTVFLLANLVFIVYGSLFPFEFRDTPLPLETMLNDWRIFGNKADAIDNYLLFIPLGIGLSARFNKLTTRLLAAALSILLLGLVIQGMQLYTLNRTASLADVFWNTIGMSSGMVLHSILQARLAQTKYAHSFGREKFAMLLVLLWIFYESFPFVPTLDIGLLRDHLKSAVIAPPFEVRRLLEHGWAAMLGGMALVRLRLLPKSSHLLVWVGCAVLTLEIVVPYGALRRETLLGILSGLALSHQIEKRCGHQDGLPLLVASLGMYMLTVFTPYRGQAIDGGFTFTPFAGFLWHNVTKEIPPAAFEALALGSMVWACLTWKPMHQGKLWRSVLLLIVLVAVLEWCRMFLAGIHGDSTTIAILVVLIPFALVEKLQNQVVVDTKTQSLNSIAPEASSPLGYGWEKIAYYLLLGAFICYIALAGLKHEINPVWLVYCCTCLLGLFAALRHKLVGLLVFVAVGYGISSNGPEYDISLAIRLRDGIAFFAAWAQFIHARAETEKTRILSVPLASISVVFFLWLLVCVTAALVRGTPWGPVLRLDPSTYFQAAVFFFITANVMKDKNSFILLTGVICVTILGRCFLQGLDGVYLESYVASLLILGLPLAFVGLKASSQIIAKLFFFCVGIGMLFFLFAAQNRNAGVALFVIMVVFIVQLIFKLKAKHWPVISLMFLAIAGTTALLVPTSYLDRFSVLWDPSAQHATASLDRSTVNSRLTLWSAARDMADEHPLVGVGPGNFAHELQFYRPGSGHGGAHNSYLQMLAETGYLGLFLYLVFFLTALISLTHTQRSFDRRWQAHVAWMLQLSLIGYLALGVFNNRNDLVLAYILAGCSVALRATKVK